MIKYLHKFSTVLLIIFLGVAVHPVSGQFKASIDDRTRLIRIKRIANERKGSVLALHIRSGEVIEGQPIDVSAGNDYMQVGAIQIQNPLHDVIRVSFNLGIPELLLSVAAAFLGGAFLSGALLIANDEASRSDLYVASLLGLIGGGLWGYSNIYESEIIELE